MRILHVISGDLWAGAEVQAYTLLSSLKKNPSVEVAAALMNDGELASRLRACNIPIYIFHENRLNGLQILMRLRRLMLDWQPDVLHTHRTKENVLGSLANRLAHNIPSVRTAHGAREHAPRGLRQLHKRFFMRLDRWCGTRLQDRIIAVSKELAEKLTADFPKEKIVVIENGVDIEAIQAQVHPVTFRIEEPHCIHIGIVGRLVPVKRVDLFLETAKLLAAQDATRNWRFHVFGDGPLAGRLIAQAKSLEITDITTFHGHRSDIIACIASLDVLVMCSDHEGLPMTLLESLAVGTPVVAHAVGGLVDALPVEYLTFDHDANVYKNNLLKLLSTDISAVSAAGKQRIREKYSSIGNASRVKLLYEQLLALVQ